MKVSASLVSGLSIFIGMFFNALFSNALFSNALLSNALLSNAVWASSLDEKQISQKTYNAKFTYTKNQNEPVIFESLVGDSEPTLFEQGSTQIQVKVSEFFNDDGKRLVSIDTRIDEIKDGKKTPLASPKLAAIFGSPAIVEIGKEDENGVFEGINLEIIISDI